MNTNKLVNDIQIFQLKYTGLIQSYLDSVNNNIQKDFDKEISSILKKISKDYKINYDELADKYLKKHIESNKKISRKDDVFDSEYNESELYNKVTMNGNVLYVPDSGTGNVFDHNRNLIGKMKNNKLLQ
jgi:hypothetical protein